jgi:hypothetical protein
MPFQWLTMRIGEERERREREETALAKLPMALMDLHQHLTDCVEAYAEAFGKESASIHFFIDKIRITTCEPKDGKWEVVGKVEIVNVKELPGFKVDRGTDDPLMIEVVVFSGDKFSYRQADQYLTINEVTRRILDRLLFPKLEE